MAKFFDNQQGFSKEIITLSKMGLKDEELEYIINKKLKEQSEEF